MLFNLLSNNDNNSHEGINKKSSVNKQKTTTTADCENENLIEEAAVLTTTTTSITNPISSKNSKLSNTNDDSSIPKPPPRGLKLSRKPPEKENTSKNDSKPGHSSGSSSPEKGRSSPLFRKNVNKDLSTMSTTTPTPTYPLAKSPARISKSSSRMRKQKMETLDTKKVLNKNKMKSHSMGSMLPTKLPSDTEEGAENLVTSCMQYLYENESYQGGGDFSKTKIKKRILGYYQNLLIHLLISKCMIMKILPLVLLLSQGNSVQSQTFVIT